MEDVFSREWEPKAALPAERLAMLSAAKRMGIRTLASIEPVIIPSQSLLIMEAAAGYVDEFKIGKWNHDERADVIDWKKFLSDATVLMRIHNQKFVIKEDLLKAAGER